MWFWGRTGFFRFAIVAGVREGKYAHNENIQKTPPQRKYSEHNKDIQKVHERHVSSRLALKVYERQRQVFFLVMTRGECSHDTGRSRVAVMQL